MTDSSVADADFNSVIAHSSSMKRRNDVSSQGQMLPLKKRVSVEARNVDEDLSDVNTCRKDAMSSIVLSDDAESPRDSADASSGDSKVGAMGSLPIMSTEKQRKAMKVSLSEDDEDDFDDDQRPSRAKKPSVAVLKTRVASAITNALKYEEDDLSSLSSSSSSDHSNASDFLRPNARTKQSHNKLANKRSTVNSIFKSVDGVFGDDSEEYGDDNEACVVLDEVVASLIDWISSPSSFQSCLEERHIDTSKIELAHFTPTRLAQSFAILRAIEGSFDKRSKKRNADDDEEETDQSFDFNNLFYEVIPHVMMYRQPITRRKELISKVELLLFLKSVSDSYRILYSPKVVNRRLVGSSLSDNQNIISNIVVSHDCLIGNKIVPSEIIDESTVKAVVETPEVSVLSRFSRLKVSIQSLDMDASTALLIKNCVKYGALSCNSLPSGVGVSVSDIFSIVRPADEFGYHPYLNLDNRHMLWRPVADTCIASILRSGVTVPDASVPVSSFQFGRGIYFYDVLGAALKSDNGIQTSLLKSGMKIKDYYKNNKEKEELNAKIMKLKLLIDAKKLGELRQGSLREVCVADSADINGDVNSVVTTHGNMYAIPDRNTPNDASNVERPCVAIDDGCLENIITDDSIRSSHAPNPPVTTIEARRDGVMFNFTEAPMSMRDDRALQELITKRDALDCGKDHYVFALLYEVYLGDSHVCTDLEDLKTLPFGKHSIKSTGKNFSDLRLAGNIDGAMCHSVSPDAPPRASHNTYVIFDSRQCRLRYIVRLKLTDLKLLSKNNSRIIIRNDSTVSGVPAVSCFAAATPHYGNLPHASGIEERNINESVTPQDATIFPCDNFDNTSTPETQVESYETLRLSAKIVAEDVELSEAESNREQYDGINE